MYSVHTPLGAGLHFLLHSVIPNTGVNCSKDFASNPSGQRQSSPSFTETFSFTRNSVEELMEKALRGHNSADEDLVLHLGTLKWVYRALSTGKSTE